MKLAANLLKISLLLALLPASASAITITISAPNDAATTLDVTMEGEIQIRYEDYRLRWSNLLDYTNDEINNDVFDLTAGITANGNPVTKIKLDNDGPGEADDFELWHFFSAGVTYSFSGSATFNLLDQTSANFGDLNVGTYSLDGLSSNPEDTGHSLVIQYSSVPDTGSTAALLGVGAAALAFARRRLG